MHACEQETVGAPVVPVDRAPATRRPIMNCQSVSSVQHIEAPPKCSPRRLARHCKCTHPDDNHSLVPGVDQHLRRVVARDAASRARVERAPDDVIDALRCEQPPHRAGAGQPRQQHGRGCRRGVERVVEVLEARDRGPVVRELAERKAPYCRLEDKLDYAAGRRARR